MEPEKQDSAAERLSQIVKLRIEVDEAKGLQHNKTQKFKSVIEEEHSDIADWHDRIEDYGAVVPVLTNDQIMRLFETRCQDLQIPVKEK